MNVEALVIGHEAVEVGSALKITECTSPSKLFTCDTRSTVTCHENDVNEVDTTVDLKAQPVILQHCSEMSTVDVTSKHKQSGPLT